MTNATLTIAIDENPRTAALISGAVTIDGIDVALSTDRRGPALFRHQLQTREFGVCDMSMTTVYMMADRGDASFLALPVFTMRHFFHTTALVRVDAHIEHPSDLVGKRVGIPGYQSAASLWCRAALRHEFGVSELDVEWFTERVPDAASGEVVFDPPDALHLHVLPDGESVLDRLRRGELDAVVNVMRPPADLFERGDVVRLFGDPAEEGIRYFRATGMYPTNHCLVVRRDVVDADPSIPARVYRAFVEANNMSVIPVKALDPFVETGVIDAETRRGLSRNLFDYGIEDASLVLTAFGTYCFEQGYTSRPLMPEEVFSDPAAR